MKDFAALPEVLDAAELGELRKQMTAAAMSDTEPDFETMLDVTDKMLRGYTGALMRLRLAELALYRTTLLAADMHAEIEAGKKRRAGGPSPEGLANMLDRFVRDYVNVILPAVREATDYEEGAEHDGYYIGHEDARAKLLGNERAKERLGREGHPGLP